MALMVILSMALNSYWMWLMIKMMYRVIRRALEPKPIDPIEKVELVKADALAMDNEVDDGNSTQGSNAGDIPEEGQGENVEVQIEEEV
jgi:hypothetical protein|mmetsp:Transcript_653/g.881  ORF Transcript_653/g.881 Transcript_653/m.881 type:complete len:88 (-) Transcript_653:155-418(-)|eukprot:CAMPEP_0185583044 /NCGR_PEP_ID=MMETSP0434-20130131/21286_1 /TAXON_ID=626734 ORGANISM="Favella taraikaensis, Strain Fe Narragansett Bay" /NCGR_SAMPLE_ID=MMETSP0434 /ASSEMBLY_ACC=CAM_ASM_000379 /LENGTH=87 /DNA_ID=CAMNT_0028202035 /DNA_START=788 /DNA_END=1051 /DNA_ORIENTATION=+